MSAINCFSAGTDDKVIQVLTNAHESRDRIRLVYGDPKTGKDWLEENDVIGRVGCSTGEQKIPLLIANERSMGGGGILTANILKIVRVSNKQVLYQHDKYIEPKLKIDYIRVAGIDKHYVDNMTTGDAQAIFKTHDAAIKYIDFMLCKRMRKH